MNRAILSSALALASTAMFAQQSANTTAAATATLLKPITITKVTDMAFGNVVFDGVTAGTAVMPVTTAGAGAITTSGGVSATYGTQTAASFTIGGKANKTYTIALATVGGGNVTLGAATTPANTITVTALTINAANGITGGNIGTLSAGRADTVYVGGTLNVPTTALEDTYSTATGGKALQVTVAYN